MSSHAQTHDDPIKPYFMVYGALLVLTVLTVLVSTTFNIGHISHSLSLGVAMLIAATKGSLVLVFFMHVLHESKLIPLVLVVAFFFLALFISLTMVDVATRGVGDQVAGSQSFRELNNIAVINDVPSHEEGHGAEGAEHGAEGAEHGAEGAEHGAEGDAQHAAAEGTEHAPEGAESAGAEDAEPQTDDAAPTGEGEEAPVAAEPAH